MIYGAASPHVLLAAFASWLSKFPQALGLKELGIHKLVSSVA
jgi:hypothetical protein